MKRLLNDKLVVNQCDVVLGTSDPLGNSNSKVTDLRSDVKQRPSFFILNHGR
jgi:hypothetical protein